VRTLSLQERGTGASLPGEVEVFTTHKTHVSAHSPHSYPQVLFGAFE
jgi:hypothetical protein